MSVPSVNLSGHDQSQFQLKEAAQENLALDPRSLSKHRRRHTYIRLLIGSQEAETRSADPRACAVLI